MTLPRKAQENYFVRDDAVYTSFHNELAGALDYVRNQWAAKKYMSPSATQIIIAGLNDKLPFTYNAVNYVATITAGQYRHGNLCVEVSTQMNTAASVSVFSCTYDRDLTKKYSINRSGALAFNLRCSSATSTDKQDSIFPTLGFDCSADKTGAATDLGYTSDYMAVSSYGRFEIYASGARQNNKLYYNDGSARIATITTAVYNLKSLLSEIQYQMCTTSSVSDYAAIHDDEIMRWILKKGTGSFTLSTGTGDILPTLGGFTTAVSATSHESLAQAIHNYELFSIDLQGALQMDLLAVIGANIQSTGLITLYGGAGAIPSFASNNFDYDFVYAERLMHKWPDLSHNGGIFTAPNYRYWTFEISDATNPAKWVGFGLPWGGPYFELSHNFDFGAQYGLKSNSFKGKTDSRNTIGNRRNSEFFHTYPYHNLTDVDLDALIDEFQNLDILKPGIWAKMPAVDRWTIYGTYAKQDVRASAQLNRWNLTLEVDEEL